MSLGTVRVFAIAKLPWIKKQQQKLQEQERETPREYIDRKSHYVWGRRYLMEVIEVDQRPSFRGTSPQPHSPACASGHRRIETAGDP
jgi:predicted metal-dependent hydrolase